MLGQNRPKVFDENPEQLTKYLKEHYPDATYKAAYEAGCFRFWGQHELQALSIKTMIINPLANTIFMTKRGLCVCE